MADKSETIYGITSMGKSFLGKSNQSYFTSLSTASAREFFKEMMTKSDVPNDAKEKFKECIGE
jgi:hypothetical protein